MGADKALVAFRGQPLVAHALGIVRGAGLDAAIAGARSDLASFAPVVADVAPGAGPLAGICAAMTQTAARWSVFVPVDMPLLPPSLLRFLLDRERTSGSAITTISVAGFAETFPAVLDRAALPWLQSELDVSRGGCFAAFKAAATGLGQRLDIVAVEELDANGAVGHPKGLPATGWLLNINSTEDLDRAEALWDRFFA
jgi:molybdenum cofactor guanylyltransferase